MADMQSIIDRLQDDIHHNKIKLPTQPEIAVKIREIEEDENILPAKVASIISLDPGLAARIIRIANSPLMRGTTEISSLQNAVTRLGLSFVCHTVVGLAMEQIFQATHELIDKYMYQVWNESTEVAAYSHVIAKNFTSLPPEMASLAGLMHRVGILPLLTYAADHNELLEDEILLKDLIHTYHPTIGESILKAWDFPEEIVNIHKIFNNHKTKTLTENSACFSDVIAVAVDQYNKKHQLPIEIQESEVFYKNLQLSADGDFISMPNINAELEAALKMFGKH